MEEKEISSASGSLGISETESPPQVSNSVPQVMNMTVAISMGAATAPASGGGGQASSVADLFGKKKRGRPRKYDSDGNLRVTYPPAVASPRGFSLSPSSHPPDFSSFKRGRGRPSGSGNWQLLASLGELFAETAGGDFTPHVVTVNTGEDVAGKILAFAQKGPRGICILSANGAVSNVTFRQPGSSGGILTYEGLFEILSLSGSFTVTDTGGVRSRTGGLSASLAGPDGRVVGGGIAGLLVAASPIQIVAGSFMPNGYKAHKRKHFREQGMHSMIQGAPETVTAATPISQAKPDPVLTHLSSASPWPLPGQSHGEANNSPRSKPIPNTISSQTTGWNDSERSSDQRPYTISSQTTGWNDSERSSDQRPYPDINVTVSGE